MWKESAGTITVIASTNSTRRVQYQPFESDDEDDWDDIAPVTPATSPMKAATQEGAFREQALEAFSPKVLTRDYDSDVVLRRTPLIHWYRANSKKELVCPSNHKNSSEADQPLLSSDADLLSKLDRLQQDFSALEIKQAETLTELKSTQEKLASSREHETDVYAETLILQEELAELKLQHAETLNDLQDTKNELEGIRSEREHLVSYQSLEEEHRELQLKYGELLEKFQVMQDELKLEAAAFGKQRDDLERKLSKKEDAVIRTKQEVETLKKVISLTTSMVAMQHDHAETADAEKEMLLQNYMEKTEKLEVKLAESTKREEEAVMSFQNEIKVLSEKLAAATKAPQTPVKTAKVAQIKSTPSLVPTVSFEDGEMLDARTPMVFPYDEDNIQRPAFLRTPFNFAANDSGTSPESSQGTLDSACASTPYPECGENRFARMLSLNMDNLVTNDIQAHIQEETAANGIDLSPRDLTTLAESSQGASDPACIVGEETENQALPLTMDDPAQDETPYVTKGGGELVWVKAPTPRGALSVLANLVDGSGNINTARSSSVDEKKSEMITPTNDHDAARKVFQFFFCSANNTNDQ
ncbi:expressed unknown protein [Seminavis robusta]|uniref:Uncharacterized protein n=1 Tax=Seminavis robusta TaxID=568900 RepID=A0A9N8HNJ0_9STRA|nr:expressed unknown protein [Seminavis robusta]|eukprot:Sro1220_g253520.1 n/a (586) ;mRNA; f:10907-12664